MRKEHRPFTFFRVIYPREVARNFFVRFTEPDETVARQFYPTLFKIHQPRVRVPLLL